MSALFRRFPFLPKLDADGGYRGDRFRKGVKQALRQVDVEIVKRSGRTEGFAVLPKRRVVERTFARFVRPVRPLPSIGERPAYASTPKPGASLVWRPSAICCEHYAKHGTAFGLALSDMATSLLNYTRDESAFLQMLAAGWRLMGN